MAYTEPIRNKKDVQRLAKYFKERGELRNHVLIMLSIYTALRVSDILSLKWDDVYDFERNRFNNAITLTEQKTGKSKIVALNREVISALKLCLPEAEKGAFLMLNERTGRAIGRIQAYRLIRDAAADIGISPHVSCHSLRKTFGYHSVKAGVTPAILMEIYNHSSFAMTQRYLGLTQDDMNDVYLNLSFKPERK